MLQYGKPINKNSKSIDLKIECPCLSLSHDVAFWRGFLPISGGDRGICCRSVNERLLFDRQA
jgi:hypothetical protein